LTGTVLVTERTSYPTGTDNTDEGASWGDAIWHRPAGIYLQNDGVIRYWLVEGYSYQLDHDDTGWVVNHAGQPYGGPGHVHRLAAGGVLVDWLPVGDGRIELDPARRYEIRMGAGALLGALLVELP
jgi:hypothetical protein